MRGAAPRETGAPLLPAAYFGLTFGSPPGEPGGGMTMIEPPGSGAFFTMPGSTVLAAGGLMTPSERESWLLRLPPSPVAPLSGMTVLAGGVVGACWAAA